MNRHASMILALPTTLLLLNTASAEEIIKDKPAPSRAEGAPLSYAYGRDRKLKCVRGVRLPIPGWKQASPDADIVTNITVEPSQHIISAGIFR